MALRLGKPLKQVLSELDSIKSFSYVKPNLRLELQTGHTLLIQYATA